MYDPSDPRKYDSPASEQDIDLYQDSKLDAAKEKAGEALDIVKANKKIIIGAIIAIIVLFLIADFFFFSVKAVTFDVSDTEGQNIDNATIRISDQSNNTVATLTNNETTNLRKGTYYYSVTSSGYKSITRNELLVEESLDKPVTLEKNYKISLSIAETFPEKLVAGQVFDLDVILTNEDQTQQQIELVFEGALSDDTMTASYAQPLVVSNTPKTLTVTFTVKSNATEKQGMNGTIRVKGLDNSNAKKSVTFDIQAFNASKLSISGSTNFGTIEEGTSSTEKVITIKNQNEFDVENLQIEIVINSTQFSPQNSVPEWFSFSRTSIPVIKAYQTETIGISVTVPTGKINFSESATQDNIQGQIVFKTSYFEVRKELDLIAKKSDAKIEVSGVQATKSINFDDETQTYPTTPVTITLKNTGNLAIKNVSLTGTCDTGNWIIFTPPFDFFDTILPNDSKQATFKIEVPSSQDIGTLAICSVTASYDNPRNVAPFTLEETKPFTLTTS